MNVVNWSREWYIQAPPWLGKRTGHSLQVELTGTTCTALQILGCMGWVNVGVSNVYLRNL